MTTQDARKVKCGCCGEEILVLGTGLHPHANVPGSEAEIYFCHAECKWTWQQSHCAWCGKYIEQRQELEEVDQEDQGDQDERHGWYVEHHNQAMGKFCRDECSDAWDALLLRRDAVEKRAHAPAAPPFPRVARA